MYKAKLEKLDRRQGHIHSYESCSVVHEAKNASSWKHTTPSMCLMCPWSMLTRDFTQLRLLTLGLALLLTWIGLWIKQFNSVALLDFRSVIGLHGSHFYSETKSFCRSCDAQKNDPLIYSWLFHNISWWEKVTQHCNYTVWPLCKIGVKACIQLSLFIHAAASQLAWLYTCQLSAVAMLSLSVTHFTASFQNVFLCFTKWQTSVEGWKVNKTLPVDLICVCQWCIW